MLKRVILALAVLAGLSGAIVVTSGAVVPAFADCEGHPHTT